MFGITTIFIAGVVLGVLLTGVLEASTREDLRNKAIEYKGWAKRDNFRCQILRLRVQWLIKVFKKTNRKELLRLLELFVEFDNDNIKNPPTPERRETQLKHWIGELEK